MRRKKQTKAYPVIARDERLSIVARKTLYRSETLKTTRPNRIAFWSASGFFQAHRKVYEPDARRTVINGKTISLNSPGRGTVY